MATRRCPRREQLPEGDLRYAAELVRLARELGLPSVGVALHPEGHPAAPSRRSRPASYQARQQIRAAALRLGRSFCPAPARGRHSVPSSWSTRDMPRSARCRGRRVLSGRSCPSPASQARSPPRTAAAWSGSPTPANRGCRRRGSPRPAPTSSPGRAHDRVAEPRRTPAARHPRASAARMDGATRSSRSCSTRRTRARRRRSPRSRRRHRRAGEHRNRHVTRRRDPGVAPLASLSSRIARSRRWAAARPAATRSNQV